MRCAIDFDEDKPLSEQSVRAWGELQTLNEEPSYREEDIKKESNKQFFHGYKCALDDVCNILAMNVDDETISEEASDEIQTTMAGSLCEQLFSILDDEYEDE